ncbi:MAG TPA: protein kinase, partial [Vicinamibacteria bacterium]|nr:protein kinase [Vicinamibacteria bacterium]
FEREAKLLAALNHSNIAHVYGFEGTKLESGATVHFLAMELVEGEDLSERLKRGAIPVDESVGIAKQIAEALEEAHEHGIVHRDLKPANVKVTLDGKVKVLDFGLAKAFTDEPAPSASGDVSHSPTLSAQGTRAGVILGTAAYMSPEQARGKAVDKRADIWAFGVVLFEMLTGKRLFSGETTSDVLAAVLTRDPDWAALPAGTPPRIPHLLRRCLERNPRNRLRDVGDARLTLDDVVGGRVEPPASAAAAVLKSRARLPWAIALVSAGVALAVLLVARSQLRSGTGSPAVLRLPFLPGKGERLPSSATVQKSTFALSPDGTKLVYLVETGATTELRLRSLDSDVSTTIPGAEGGVGPFFSPDGRWVGFFVGPKLEKVALAGGAPIALADAPDPRGAVWGEDGNIYFVPNAYVPVTRVPAAGGAAVPVTQIRNAEGELQHRWPELLPGARVLLYAIGYGEDWDTATIVAQRLDTGERTVLVKGGSSPRYLPTGQLVYARAGGLYAVGLDPRTLAVTGPPVEVARNVYRSPTGNATMDVSRTGLLVAAPADEAGGASVLSWIDRSGRSDRLPIAAADYSTITLSPAGDRAALGVGNSLGVLDLSRLSLARLSLSKRAECPVWSRDGRRLLFGYEASASGFELHSKAADDSGEPMILAHSGATEDPYGVTRDGSSLVSIRFPRNGLKELLLRDAHKPESEPKVLLRSRYLQWRSARLSPDDRWVVYESTESGRPEVYVRPVSGEERKWQISVDGGTNPVWSRAGDEIFFLCGERFMAAPVRGKGDDLMVGTPQVLFEGHRIVTFDAAPDGRRFLVAENPAPGAQHRLEVVVNWFAEVRRKVAEARAP